MVFIKRDEVTPTYRILKLGKQNFLEWSLVPWEETSSKCCFSSKMINAPLQIHQAELVSTLCRVAPRWAGRIASPIIPITWTHCRPPELESPRFWSPGIQILSLFRSLKGHPNLPLASPRFLPIQNVMVLKKVTAPPTDDSWFCSNSIYTRNIVSVGCKHENPKH